MIIYDQDKIELPNIFFCRSGKCEISYVNIMYAWASFQLRNKGNFVKMYDNIYMGVLNGGEWKEEKYVVK